MPEQPSTRREWAVQPALIACCALAGLLLGVIASGVLAPVAAFLDPDPGGRLLLGGAAILLVLLALVDTVVRPRLAVDDTGVTVRTMGGRLVLPWARAQIRVVTRRRLGQRQRTLEVDDGEALAVLGRRELGTDPQSVADEITRLRTGHP